MKRIVIIALFAALSACTSPTEKARDIHDELVYFKDHRTGLCFAFWKHPNSDSMDTAIMSHVPCDAKVESLLVNGAERGR